MTKKTTKQNEQMTIEPIEGTVSSPLVIPADDVEEAVILEETTEAPESHFIESNTQPITLEELSEKNIVPTFGDGTVSTSHQSFIESVLEAGRTVFGDLSPVDIRVSHPINGRVPSALHKKANELLEVLLAPSMAKRCIFASEEFGDITRISFMAVLVP